MAIKTKLLSCLNGAQKMAIKTKLLSCLIGAQKMAINMSLTAILAIKKCVTLMGFFLDTRYIV
jgi:hypothetical protein